MSEEEKELAAKFLVREPMKKGGGFSWRLNEPAIAEACEQRGWQWYLSNFPVTAAELWSLEAQRRSSGEFMSAEFYDICADDYLPPVFYTVGAAEKNGCNFVKFCALICSEGLRRIFEDARARVAEIARQSPVEPGIERVKSNLEFDSHMSMLDTCDLYEDEPKEFGAEFKLMQRIFLETEAA